MNSETHQNNRLREYLLGKISHEDEREKIENQLMDDSFFEDLLITETEIIDDYVNQRLAPDEIEGFRNLFLVSDERRERIKFAQALRNHVKNEAKEFQESDARTTAPGKLLFFKDWLTRKWLLAPAFAGLVLLLLVAGIYLFWKPVSDDKVLAQLNKAYKKERPFEARISGLNYAPINTLRGETRAVDSNARNYAEVLSQDALAQKTSAQNLHNLGRVYLAEEKFDDAIKQLELAEKADAGRAELLSDLGTAYLEKGKTLSVADGQRLELAARSLEYFERALKIKPNLPEALFNRAICLQYLNLPRQSREAWQKYLDIDSGSSWAEEAKKNQQLIDAGNAQTKTSSQILQDFLSFYERSDHDNAWLTLSRNREMITGKLIPQQLAGLFLEADENEKGRYLAALKYAGELSRKRSNDPFFAEIAQFYSNVPPEKLELLRAAQVSVKKGYELCINSDFHGALDSFKIAHQNFAEAGNKNEAQFTEYWISYCDFQLGDIVQSTNRLQTLETSAQKNNYQWFLATVLARLSINYFTLGDQSKVIQYNQNSLALAENLNDLHIQQGTLSQLSNKYLELNRFDKSYEYMQKSFRLFDLPETSARQRWRIYEAAGRLFVQAKLYAVAISINREALKLNDEEIKDDSYTYWNYYRLSQIYGSQKMFDAALQTANRSIEAASRMKDEKQRLRGTAFTILNLAHLQRQNGNCDEALINYNRSLEVLYSIEASLNNYEAEKGQLLCYAEKHDQKNLTEKLPQVLQKFEQNRSKILEEQNRNTFFDREQSVYDLAINYEVNQGNAERAFNYSEQSRSRSLLDFQKNKAQISFERETPQIIFNQEISKPLNLSDLQLRMPNRAQLIQYAVTENRVLIWLVTKNNFRQYIADIRAEDLNLRVEGLLQAVQEMNSEKQRELSKQLYQILFQPLDSDLNPNDTVYLVPDKVLFHLPFAALISTRTDDYLLANHCFVVAPSANVFLVSSENARNRKNVESEKILSVGNPTFDRQEFPSLSLLPAARQEAVAVAGFYALANTFLEDRATKANFLKNFSEADIVHFAGHYVVNKQSPMLSGFLMSGDGNEGTLTNYDLLKFSSGRPKLIVLSACESGIERYYEGEGMIGAARTFLALGIPLIVASQWQVDSEATAKLMSAFHRQRTQNKASTVEALHQAQLEMLRQGKEEYRQPYYWAAFSVIGGATNF